ncbi:MAG: hypothetical protein U0264_11020 [Candidatus Kapaibacterium sp.]
MKDLLLKWLQTIEKHDGIPPEEVIAFNFGMYETEAGYSMYLVGGFEYSDDNDDWACLDVPTSDYRHLFLPDELQSIAPGAVAEYCAKIFKELEAEGKLATTLVKNAIAITIGFDDGVLIKIR